MHIELPRVCVMFITACTRSGLLCALGACFPPVRSALGARKCIEARRQGSNWLSPQAVTKMHFIGAQSCKDTLHIELPRVCVPVHFRSFPACSGQRCPCARSPPFNCSSAIPNDSCTRVV